MSLYLRPCSFLFLMIVVSASMAQVAPAPSVQQRQLELGKLFLDLTIDPEQQTISGSATIAISFSGKPEAIELDLDAAMIVNKVWINGDQVSFKRSENKLFVDVPTHQPLSLRVDYGGRPRVAQNPPWRGGFNWSRDDAGNPWVGVTTQNESGMLWFPCVGGTPIGKFRGAKLQITVPEDLYCAANGLLVSVSPPKNGRRTFVWNTDYAISHYNVNLNIGRYQLHERVYRGSKEMPVIFYALEGFQKDDREHDPELTYQEKINRALDLSLEYLTFYAKYYGEYPFINEKFAFVHTDYFGMEHQTINAYGNHFRIEKGYDYILLHEMGHEWWGNKITVSNWADFWVHEGICTYTTGIYLEERYGKQAGIDYFKEQAGHIVNEQPVVLQGSPESFDAYHGDIYYKGALIVYALRGLLGRKKVDQILYNMAVDPNLSYLKPASTTAFIQHAERVAKQDLDWFFNAYLYKAELPELKITKEKKSLLLKWADPAFTMPLEVALTSRGKTKIKRLSMANGQGLFRPRKGQTWTLDPRHFVLKKVTTDLKTKGIR